MPDRSDLCQILLAAGVPVDTRDNLHRTPLHLACHCAVYECGGEEEEAPHYREAEQSAIVSPLLEAGADRRAQDREGRTPVDIATARGWNQIVAIMTRQDKTKKQR